MNRGLKQRYLDVRVARVPFELQEGSPMNRGLKRAAVPQTV